MEFRMSRIKQKIAAAMTVFVLAGSICGSFTAAFATGSVTRQQEPAAGQAAFPKHELMMQYVESIPERQGTAKLRSATYQLSSEWSASGNDYYFSQLSTAEKKMYLQLKQAADAYLTGVDNFMSTTVNGKTIYILPQVSYEQLEGDWYEERLLNAGKVINCFIFENPQYYFIRQALIYTTKSIAVQLYDDFSNGAVRDAFTQQFEEQIYEWEAQVDVDADKLTKELQIHQIVCDNVDYDESVADDPEDRRYSQSCISAVLSDRRTVCAGYAQLFNLLCNRAGVQCISVTSEGHEWNKVCLGGKWYNVDCTWDDTNPKGNMSFFNVADAYIQAEDTAHREHILEEKWAGLVPECPENYDYTSYGGEDMVNILVPQKMEEVNADSSAESEITIYFPLIDGCDGYTIQYAADKNMKPNRKKNVDGTKTTYSIKGLLSGETYYVRVRGYVLDSSGTNIYGAYSKKIKVQVK